MTGDFGGIGEGIGELASGAAAARAIEPYAGEGDGHTHEGACLNCGTPLVGTHCHSCGQRAHVHRTIGAFFHDLLHGVLHFEGKTWRTLPMLAWKPGQLTREYIEGKRAKYISPIALYLFVVFVSFALWSALGGFGDIDEQVSPPSTEQMQANVEKLDDEIVRLQDRIDKRTSEGASEADLAELRGELETAQKAKRLATDLIGTVSDTDITIRPSVDGKGTEAEKNFADWLDHAWAKAKANPQLLLYKLQTNAYKLSWVLIPLSLPFMWLLFPFSRRYHLYDHTVFVTYSIAFMTILIFVASMGAYLAIEPLVIAPLLYAPFHLYRQLRGAYEISRFGAIWRLLVLSAMIYVVLALFAVLMLSLVIG